ncbi:multiprotein-bridging factor 1 [Ophiostoma piceae UAMH 11346]|uniref:Multiprotein-bridging factor 1 n=1 Tax=Ophiostoma piceae (strain UAMH 11346) TaxID=1262450 RepID=S3BUR5_OPHP1|nr:multiprotein-bridging factor 1 [Ophiostoma piceae UAMH 11346]
MSMDWDEVTKIGSQSRGGTVARPTVVRSRAALNAAQRSGAIIATEKKYVTGNAAKKAGGTGQKDKSLDDYDGDGKPIAVKHVGKEVGAIIADRRSKREDKMTQKQLATRCNTTASIIGAMERGEGQPDQRVLGEIEKVLNVRLRGSNLGKPRFEKKQ